MSMQKCGAVEVLQAMDAGEKVTLILVKRDHNSSKITNLVSRAESLGIRVIEGSQNDLWRMSR
ncbi:MAG TPA: hypothetical protein QF525_05740, partial [Candidatus Thalassarchaeaceae archaeon]|nr:hypothetical protein [Candidatus Thalassarchaeaceae archaeon]